nr:carboxymuconolactone decarboxylase family protein [uncultured Duganella sp.]
MQSTIGHQSMAGVAPKLAELTDAVLFDDIWRRPQLSPRERSVATVSALVAMYRVEQLPFHLALARDNGVTFEELGEIITHLAFYAGWPAAASAVNLLKQLEESSCP